jgi:hypothetical protein
MALFSMLLAPNLGLHVLVGAKNARNSVILINNTILINSANFFKKLEKNTLKQSLESKKGAN